MEVICVSSDDSNDDDVEIVSYSEFTKSSDPLPLSEVRVDVETVNVNIPRQYIDLTDPKWAFPELKLRKNLDFPSPPVIDLTESGIKGTELQTEKKSLNVRQLEKSSSHINSFSKNKDIISLESSPKDSKSPQKDCGTQKPAHRHLSSPTQPQKESIRANSCHDTPVVKLTRLPFHETFVSKQNTSECSDQFANDFSQMSLCFRQLNGNSEIPECTDTLKSKLSKMEPLLSASPPEVMKSPTGQQINSNLSLEQLQESEHLQHPDDCSNTKKVCSDANLNNHNTWENELDCSHSYNHVSSPCFISSPQAKAQKETLVSNSEQMEIDQSESGQRCPSNHSSSRSPTSRVRSCEKFNSNLVSHISFSSISNGNQSPTAEQMLRENTPEWQLETGTYDDDLGSESPALLSWQGESDGEDMSKESTFGKDFRAVSRDDRNFVCPVALRKAMTAPTQVLLNEDYEISGAAEVLCRQSLSLIYSTIDENYPEGTLQLLSDLLQPGYYPPKDITSHLLRGILLDPQSPYHLCVQAFNLLMWTQRHHRVSKSTVPWDWELLTTVLSNQDCKKEHRCEVVRMLLEYVVQTLEDDFKAKCSTSVLHHSITKATLSCDQQFPHVRDVIRWLFSAIKKSTELGECKEKDDRLRMVSLFQRMLSLALEVDRCPALNSAKLSQELFHMVLSLMSPRAHRMLLLKSLQSKLLLCKLLEQLLDYACPQKISVPMSLSLLLHFLKNCTLAPDPMDGTERWQKWEELIHLLWMLLLSYNNAMKGYLSSFSTERAKAGSLVYKPDDMVTKPAVREAVESYLSRSWADLGQALPLHVEESLTYLQDYLLDVCQC